MSPVNALWGLKRLASRPWPTQGASLSAAAASVLIDLTDFAPKAILSTLYVRIVGTIVKTGATAGTPTGRENPEALVRFVTANTVPTLGMINKNSLSGQGFVSMGIFDRSFGVRGADQIDDVSNQAIDMFFPLVYKQNGALKPFEWGLPLELFDSYNLEVAVGGKEQLFTGGAFLWDLSGLQIEFWADFDDLVSPDDRKQDRRFHQVEEFERTIPVTASQTDLELDLSQGFLYTHLLFSSRRDNVLVDDVINNLSVQSGSRLWTPQGENNRAVIRRWNLETHVNNVAESLVGLLFVPALRDGSYKRSVEAGDSKIVVKMDVTKTSGVEQIIVRGRRLRPLALTLPKQ